MKLERATVNDYKKLLGVLAKGDGEELDHIRKLLECSTDDFLKLLIKGVENDVLYKITHKGVTLAVGGVDSIHVWFQTSRDINKLSHGEKVSFYHILKSHLASELDKHIVLSNVVYAGNEDHIRLLEILGATIDYDAAANALIPFKFTRREPCATLQ